jgi:cellulose synthase operon protein C
MSGRDAAILRSLADRIDPGDAGAHNNLGVVFFQKGLIDDAIAAFVRALDLDPHLEVARRNVEIALVDSGCTAAGPGAEEHLRDAPDDPGRPQRPGPDAYAGGRRGAAALEWSRLLGEDPDSVALHLKLADAEARRGRPARALALLGRAAELSPTDSACTCARRSCWTREGAVRAGGSGGAQGAGPGRGDLVRGHACTAGSWRRLGRAEEAGGPSTGSRPWIPQPCESNGYLSLDRYRSVTSARATRPPVAETDGWSALGRYRPGRAASPGGRPGGCGPRAGAGG